MSSMFNLHAKNKLPGCAHPCIVKSSGTPPGPSLVARTREPNFLIKMSIEKQIMIELQNSITEISNRFNRVCASNGNR
jgi:hypothetical protein